MSFATESEFLDSHLKPAPMRLQRLARDLFRTQADYFRSEAATSKAPESLEGVMQELDARFSELLRRSAAERAEAGHGLLLVDGHDFAGRVRGKHYLTWYGGESLFGTDVGVLIVFDRPDEQLIELDRAYAESRSVWLADRLQTFNNRMYEERAAEIQAYRAFQQSRGGSTPEKDWFGVPWQHHKHLQIDPSVMQVVPKSE